MTIQERLNGIEQELAQKKAESKALTEAKTQLRRMQPVTVVAGKYKGSPVVEFHQAGKVVAMIGHTKIRLVLEHLSEVQQIVR